MLRAGDVTLMPVDEQVLEELVAAATSDAAPDEVTPPVGPGDGWTAERVAWLAAFHRERRGTSPDVAGERTWAVLVRGRVVGSVRLAPTAHENVLETGVWLTRGARGHGAGRAALGAVLREAASLGATAVRAETTAVNGAALAVLGQLGFACVHTDDGRVTAHLVL